MFYSDPQQSQCHFLHISTFIKLREHLEEEYKKNPQGYKDDEIK